MPFCRHTSQGVQAMTSAGRPVEPTLLDSLFPGGDDAATTARKTAWEHTELGDPERWGPELCAAIRTVMPSKVPMLLWWGDELVQIYNEAYRRLVGSKHPESMGQRAALSWAEVWEDLGPRVALVRDSAEANFEEDLLLLIDRHGYLEETYWTFSFSPIFSAQGGILGVFVATTDATLDVVEARRLDIVRDLAIVSSADFSSREGIAVEVIHVLEKNRQAVPFAALYLLDDSGGLVQAAGYGLSGSSAALPLRVAADDSTHPLMEVAGTRVRREMGYEPLDICSVPGPLGPRPPDSAFVVPLGAMGRPLEGVAVLGINPYRRVDQRYLTYATLVTRQLTALFVEVRAAAQERARAAALAELDQSKTEFFANVSHEFRTPLTVALAATRELRRSGLSPEQTTHVDAVQHSAVRLNRLVDTLLNFAQAEAGHLSFSPEAVNVAELTADVLGMFRSAIESAGLTLDLDVDDDLGSWQLDREAWVKVVANLVSNAYKFTETGSIAVTLSRGEDGVVLRVRDTGRGIAPDDLEVVFHRFHQVVRGPARGVVGTGIGLALVKDLVDAQGGHVDVVSTPGVGSTFTVTLPAARTGSPAPVPLEIAPLVDGLLSDLGAADEQPTVHVAGADRPTLLLVEDHADLRAYLTRLLAEDGWNVMAVPDVPSALSSRRVPDIILCDVMLPGPSGLDLVTTVRSSPEWASVPVILVTARSGPKEVAKGLSLGADDYVGKPFEPIELLARLRTHYELAKGRDARLSDAEQKADHLQTALATSRTIGVAVGVLMASHRVTSDQAFELLRLESNKTNRKLRAVAQEVVLNAEFTPTP
jgi:signal transduction histidine kinase/DNA-binding response OmpR family regulator